ncbi:acyl-[acyl-carrier-protein] thioesterase [Longibacter sp.]|uniref:acyl-[acyl-carrier-protein] thioesterase n=1 Tax=Longibacter sp. TaxID=2045415 RepID=UPI003EBF68E6
MSTRSVWTESFPIRAYDITPRGTASPLAICDFLQEAAGNHADHLGVSMEDLLSDNRAWVLAFLHLEVDRYPSWHREVTLETWPSGLDGIYATREFVLSDDDGSCARATSAWFVIDTERRRPVRPPSILHDIDLPDRPRPLSKQQSKSSVPESAPLHERDFRVRYHDLDLNRHVNNVRYVEWAVETLDAGWLDAHVLSHLTLEFRAETTADDPVRAEAYAGVDADPETTFRHHLRHADSNRTLALASTRWRLADND